MQTVTVIAVGKMKEKAFVSLCEEYEKRISGFAQVKVVELAEARLPDAPNAKQIEAALADEAVRIRKAIPAGAFVTACCVEGKAMSSPGFARALSGAENARLCFLIGGSNGLDESLKREADLRVSFSAMTFPHHLFRVMLLEQVYRAFMITAGRSYHK